MWNDAVARPYHCKVSFQTFFGILPGRIAYKKVFYFWRCRSSWSPRSNFDEQIIFGEHFNFEVSRSSAKTSFLPELYTSQMNFKKLFPLKKNLTIHNCPSLKMNEKGISKKCDGVDGETIEEIFFQMTISIFLVRWVSDRFSRADWYSRCRTTFLRNEAPAV